MTEEPRSLTMQRKSIPPHVEAAVERALEKLPADRFASAAEFGAALSDTGYRIPGTDSRTRAIALPPYRRTALPWIAAVALGFVGLLAGRWLARQPAVSDGPMRFAVDLDSAQGFPNTASVMVTPDGRTIIVSAVVQRRNVLLARRLDKLEATVIPGSEGAIRPFLSADGRWVGFAARGKLMKLPIEGGTPVTLADASWGGGSWSADGTIIYSQSYQTGLYRVSANGGEARELSKPDSASGELAHWWPQQLPDGRHVVFTAYRTPLDRATVEVLDLRTGTRKVLVQGAVMGRYVPSGHLLFARERSVLAVPFDLGRLQVTGAAVVVVDDVAMNYSDGFASYDVTPSGTLVVMPSAVSGTRYQIVVANRRGAERPVLADPDRYGNVRFAPDGRRLSVDVTPARGASDVYVVDGSRGSRTRVTSEPASDFGALWTPDGRDLVYMSERPLFELYRRAADGSRAAVQVIGGQHDRILGSISADGRAAAFVLSVSSGSDIWTVNLEGPPAPKAYLANGFNLGHPALSPDGRWMAYDSDESGRVEVYLQSYPDPTVTRQQVSSGGGSEPLWTRGGRELVFRRGDSVMAVTADPRTGEAGRPAVLFAGPYESDPEWSQPRAWDVTPDGERFAFLKWPTGTVRRQVVVATHWFDELRARVAGQREQR